MTAGGKSRLIQSDSPAVARSATTLDAIDIDTNRRLLNRYRFVQHESMRILAGWLPRAAAFELKCEMGRSLWENAVR